MLCVRVIVGCTSCSRLPALCLSEPLGLQGGILLFECSVEKGAAAASLLNDARARPHVQYTKFPPIVTHFVAPMDCAVCNKGHKTLGALNRHIKTVHERRRVPCPICESDFYDAYSMRLHIKTVHLDERYVCNICERSFRWKATMTRHRLREHGPPVEAAHVCEACGQQFVQRKELDRHVQALHPSKGKSYRCDICEAVFGWKCSLEQHRNDVHA
jgi:hypothetical protein